MERHLRRTPGVVRVEANARTGNVLVHFTPDITNVRRIIEAASRFDAGEVEDLPVTRRPADAPPVLTERRRGPVRARIAVRGMDRDPRLARIVVDRLEQHSGVRARANPLTGRVLVEIAEGALAIEELVATVADIELPALPAEERPPHPLDSGALLQSAARLGAAVIGLAIVAVRQIRGGELGRPTAVRIASLLSIAQSVPELRRLLARLLGRDAADALISLPHIAVLALANSPLGLTLAAVEALRLLTEVRSCRAAWLRREDALRASAPALPGELMRVESGERVPRAARLVEGAGTAVDPDGRPRLVAAGDEVGAGARLFGGPVLLRLEAAPAFTPVPRADPVAPDTFDRYAEVTAPASLVIAAAVWLSTRSLDRALAAMLLASPRAAMAGVRAADAGAEARVLRAGIVVAGTRPDRRIRTPCLLLLGSPRLLTDGTELIAAHPLREGLDAEDVLALAASVAAAAGGAWGGAIHAKGAPGATAGRFDGRTATAVIDGGRYVLREPRATDRIPALLRRLHAGEHLIVLRRVGERRPLGVLALRPRMAAGSQELVALCGAAGVELAVLRRGDPVAARRVAERARIPMIDGDDAVGVIRERQRGGRLVAFASDSARAAEAFAACDLAIGVADRRQHFAARADLLSPDPRGIAAIIQAGVLRDAAARDAVALSVIGNVAGIVLTWRDVSIRSAGRLVEVVALTSLGAGWLRLRGGERPWSAVAAAADPRPERWGRRPVDEVLHLLESRESGLTSEQAASRARAATVPMRTSHAFLDAVVGQLGSPLTALWAGGAILSLVVGVGTDAAIIAATLGINILAGAWQERRTDRVARALEQLERGASARVLRDGRSVVVRTSEVVTGDVMLLAAGDRVAADARITNAERLEVDEAALTGESLPVSKRVTGGIDAQRIVLEGSDVTTGTGRAVVVAVGPETRLGATAAALGAQEEQRDVLAARLARLLRQSLPVAAVGGAVVIIVGLLRGQPLLAQVALGTSVVLAAAPEGLPLLTGLGQAAAARRLAGERAVVRRLSAVEALGRVNVACVDKTGTLTRGRLAVRLVATWDEEGSLPGPITGALVDVLRAAALASPHPDAWNLASHPTDVAVIRGAEDAGLGETIRAPRERESPFDPMRAHHATSVGGRVYAKGAPEMLLDRCEAVRTGGAQRPLDPAARDAVAAVSRGLAERGLRVLLVAEGPPGSSPDDPQALTVLGFVGLADPMREDVPNAVRRCHEAGVRVIMLTGDHPLTARTIAREAGLLNGGGGVLTGPEIAELDDGALSARLEHSTVIARATPLDKLRIVESLQRRGHVVAMTGDGVNDAPALRLADVGVAMGHGGTEVARQAADVVLLDDDFSTLVRGLVEGRSFWRSTRRALGILLGGNLGELGLVIGANLFGHGAPLGVRQILAVNLITDLLPAVALATQRPPHHRLAELSREGEAALDAPLRHDIVRRAAATAIPSLATFLLSARAGAAEARSAAFASIVTTQLAQTLGAGWIDGAISPPVAAAVSLSAAILFGAFAVPGLRALIELAPLTPRGWGLVTASTLLAPLLHRAMADVLPAASPRASHPLEAVDPSSGMRYPGISRRSG